MKTKRERYKDILPNQGETNTIVYANGLSLKVELEADEDKGAPWEESGHGPVSKTFRAKEEKKAGERILCTDRNGEYAKFYDWAEAIKIAKREGWGSYVSPGVPFTGTKGQVAERAVQEDFDNLRAWCNDEWNYQGYIVTLYDAEGKQVGLDSCWGFDSDSRDYINEEVRATVANLLAKYRKNGPFITAQEVHPESGATFYAVRDGDTTRIYDEYSVPKVALATWNRRHPVQHLRAKHD